jgi:diacylglycerol kinase (ATP)
MKASLIYNSHAGHRWHGQIPVSRIVQWMSDCGVEADCHPTLSPGSGARLAKEVIQSGSQLIAVYGGDGTINEVVTGMAGSDATLAVLPGGTANVFARELKIPRNLQQAVQIACAGNTISISLGRTGNRYFHLMAGIGLDAAVVSGMPWKLKRMLGVPAFWIQGLRQLRDYSLKPFQLEVDGTCHEATFAVVANCRNYGGCLVIAPDADPRSDSLDVCLFGGVRKVRYFVYLLAGYLGKHLLLHDVRCVRGRRISAAGDPSIPVQVDGEFAGYLPMNFEIAPSALFVKVPAA